MTTTVSVMLSVVYWSKFGVGEKARRDFMFFSGLNPFKAPGPDGPRGRALSTCAPLLGPLLARLLQLFLDSMSVPRAWKSSFIIVNTSKKKKNTKINR